MIKSDINGIPTTHAIVVSGYKNGKFTIVDLDKDNGGIKTVSAGLLIGSIYLAETDFDPLIITAVKN